MNDLKKILILSFVAIFAFGFIGCSQDAEKPLCIHLLRSGQTTRHTTGMGRPVDTMKKGILMNIMLLKN